MADKILNTRVQQKHDVETNWLKATNFIPKIGEVIVYDPDETHAVARVKIGDGVKTVVELPFIDDDVKTTINELHVISKTGSWNDLENKPDQDDALRIAAETGLIEPVVADDGTIYINDNGYILTLN